MGTGLVWRAIRWRMGSSMMFLSVGVAAVAAASAGPIYLASADQSVLQNVLGNASVVSSGLTLSPPTGTAFIRLQKLSQLAARAPGGSGNSSRDRYGPAIVTVDVSAQLLSPVSGLFDGVDLISRTGVCSQVHIVSGSCPTRQNQVLLSTRSAKALGTTIGHRLLPISTSRNHRRGPPIIVSGLYVAPTRLGPFWWNSNYFGYGSSFGHGEFLDGGFVTEAGALRLAGGGTANAATVLPTADMAQIPLHPRAIAATDAPAVLRALSAYGGVLLRAGVVASSGLSTSISTVASEEHQMADTTVVISLELVLLALLVLYGVASSNSHERSPDLAIAELRGLSRPSIALLALREPAVLLALSAPAGLLVAWALVTLVGAHVFPRVPVRVDSLTVGAVLATFVAGCAATAIGARRLVSPRASAAGQDRAAKERRAARAALTLDAVTVVLAVAALVEVLSRGKPTAGAADPLAALAPALLALTAGILGARVIPLACRGIARANTWTSHVAGVLASRSLMRRPGLARRVLILSLALGLLTFAVAGIVVARANRATQALFATGAPVVLNVTVPSGVDFLSAVRKADPSGREAMAVSRIMTSNGSTLAVDSERFGAIAAWPPGTTSPATTAASIGRYLHPRVAAPLQIAGATAIRVTASLTSRVRPPPHLEVAVFDERFGEENDVDLGPLRAGTHTYTAPFLGACLTRCRVDSFSVLWVPPVGSSVSTATVPLQLSAISVQRSGTSLDGVGGAWDALRAGFADPGDWVGSSSVILAPDPTGLGATFYVNVSSSLPTLRRNDVPALLPAVVTSQVVSLNQSTAAPGQYPADGLDGNQVTVAGHIVAGALPEVGANGTLVDLQLAEAAQTSNTAAASDQVWCRAVPSTALLARLAASGVTVRGLTTAAQAFSVMNRSGPALAFDLYVFAAVAAGILALGSLLFAIATSSRHRAIELAALAAVGVPRRVLWRSLVEEYGGVAVAGVVLGLLSGVIAVTVALGALPEFPNGRVGPVLPIWVPWGPVLLVTGTALLVLLLAAVAATRLLMHQVTPDCLRMSA
jgi:putative ABC transport system permease protein